MTVESGKALIVSKDSKANVLDGFTYNNKEFWYRITYPGYDQAFMCCVNSDGNIQSYDGASFNLMEQRRSEKEKATKKQTFVTFNKNR